MDIARIEASYTRISESWRSDSALDRRIDRALLLDLLEALEELEPTDRVGRLSDRVSDLFDSITDSLTA
jgi:hypothetical protein